LFRYGYGASTKGNTLLQYFGLTRSDVVAIAERSPYKFGRTTVGTGIPIVSEDDMRAARPDYLLVLPWHFIAEFEQREKEFLDRGGAFIIPCPVFRVVKKKE
jgi:NDP-4-keto-2,6-dideoxyhexose 3-C-methyltransferase